MWRPGSGDFSSISFIQALPMSVCCPLANLSAEETRLGHRLRGRMEDHSKWEEGKHSGGRKGKRHWRKGQEKEKRWKTLGGF